MSTKEEMEFEEALNDIPEEVEDFMWSDMYDLIIEAIAKTVGLNDEQKQSIRIKSYKLVTGVKTIKEVGEELLSEGMSTETTAKVLYAINTEILSRAINLTEYFSPNNNDPDYSIAESVEKQEDQKNTTPITVDALTDIKERMTKPSIVIPSVRDYSINRSNASEKKVDPYLEIPEK